MVYEKYTCMYVCLVINYQTDPVRIVRRHATGMILTRTHPMGKSYKELLLVVPTYTILTLTDVPIMSLMKSLLTTMLDFSQH